MNERPHKIMTPEEYAALNIKGWHRVCKDVDGFGAVGIIYEPQPKDDRPHPWASQDETGRPYCADCGALCDFEHDHRPDNSGLDDGPCLPGKAPRKAMAAKPIAERQAIRRAAWSTRRAKYGQHGHR